MSRIRRYVALLRGINVGGKNTVPMRDLKECLEKLGFSNVSTYIASGNVILESDLSAAKIKSQIERALTERFKPDSDRIRVRVLSHGQLKAVVGNKPNGFGDQPTRFHSDAIFLMGVDSATAMSAFDPREGVDRIWPGQGVIYSQRLTAKRTESRLGVVMGTPVYRAMTIRSWNTTTRLLDLMNDRSNPG